MLFSSSLLALKILLISSGVVSFVLAMNYTMIQFPTIWSIMLLLFKPPYVYFVINGIIISIVASSRCMQSAESSVKSYRSPVEIPHVEEVVAFKEEEVLDVKPVVVNGIEVVEETGVIETISEYHQPIIKQIVSEYNHPATEKIISEDNHSVTDKRILEYDQPVTEKVLEVTIYDDRKPPKAGGREGRKKQILSNMDMESTWKMITEGREREQNMSSPMSREEPLLEPDELNHRVEEFIKKFKNEIKLQREESLEQYMQRLIDYEH